jgi:hypothetical protein
MGSAVLTSSGSTTGVSATSVGPTHFFGWRPAAGRVPQESTAGNRSCSMAKSAAAERLVTPILA